MNAGNQGRLAGVLASVLHWGTMLSTLLLAGGLLLTLVGLPAASLSAAGLIVLMATPIARVAVSVIDYAAQRDWPFVALTGFVLVILLGSIAIALAT